MTVFETPRCLLLSNFVCGGGKNRTVDKKDSQTCGSLASDTLSLGTVLSCGLQ